MPRYAVLDQHHLRTHSMHGMATDDCATHCLSYTYTTHGSCNKIHSRAPSYASADHLRLLQRTASTRNTMVIDGRARQHCRQEAVIETSMVRKAEHDESRTGPWISGKTGGCTRAIVVKCRRRTWILTPSQHSLPLIPPYP